MQNIAPDGAQIEKARPYAGCFSGGGGQDYLQYSRDNANEGAQRPSGRVWEGGVPPPARGSFYIFEIEIEQTGAHFGWIF